MPSTITRRAPRRAPRRALQAAALAAAVACATPALAQLTLYEDEAFNGRAFTTQQRERGLDQRAFNDRASSVIVATQRWELCEDANFGGRCLVLRPGQYPSLAEMGLHDRVSSARPLMDSDYVAEWRYAPAPLVANDYRRRPGEQLYEAQVLETRAVMAQAQQRCWTEQQQVPVEQKSGTGGAIAGAVIGGILGHQVGGGRGRDIATVGGAVAGAVAGKKIAERNNDETRTQDVQRCENVGEARPSHWDVVYTFRGEQHTVQMTQPPGATIMVNRQGEPRVPTQTAPMNGVAIRR
jgi:uncharacterized protein YcfJ